MVIVCEFERILRAWGQTRTRIALAHLMFLATFPRSAFEAKTIVAKLFREFGRA